MIQDGFELSPDQSMDVPKAVTFDQSGIIHRQQELRILVQEHVRYVIDLDQPVQLRAAQAGRAAGFITNGTSGPRGIVDQRGLFWG